MITLINPNPSCPIAQDEAVPALAGPPKLRAPTARPSGDAQAVTKSAKEIFTEWDKDSNGLIDFEEFTEVGRFLLFLETLCTALCALH